MENEKHIDDHDQCPLWRREVYAQNRSKNDGDDDGSSASLHRDNDENLISSNLHSSLSLGVALPVNPFLGLSSEMASSAGTFRTSAGSLQRRKRRLSCENAATTASIPSADKCSNVVSAAQTSIVTSSTTPTTTSDDRDSSGSGSGANGNNSADGSGGQDSSGHDSGTYSNSRRMSCSGNADEPHSHHYPHHHYTHHYHQLHAHYRSRRSGNGVSSANRNRMLKDDGSALQVPEGDGSDKLAADNAGPATVVASRYNVANSSSSAGSGAEGDLQQEEHHLFPPHREPGYHTIRRTLNRFPNRKRGGEEVKGKRRVLAKKSSATATDSSSSMEETTLDGNMGPKKKTMSNIQRRKKIEETANKRSSMDARKRGPSPSPDASEQEGNSGGSSSGSGTEGTDGGYAGSASSNETCTGRQPDSCSSPSVSSSEEYQSRCRKGKHHRLGSKRGSGKGHSNYDTSSSSSEIADFSSGSSETADDDGVRRDFEFPASPSPPLSSSNDEASYDLEESYLSAKRAADAEHEMMLKSITRKRKALDSVPPAGSSSVSKPLAMHSTKRLTVRNLDGRPPILTVGSDIMAHILTFLQPPEILDVLTMPLSKEWRKNFTLQPELWRVLCLVEPFKANMEDPSSSDDKSSTSSSVEDSDSSSGDSFYSLKCSMNAEKRMLNKFRPMYTSFVRCMKYLSQIREDAINGRPPAYIDYGTPGRTLLQLGPPSNASKEENGSVPSRKKSPSPPPPAIAGNNKNLQNFLAQARGAVLKSKLSKSGSYGENVDGEDGPKLHTAARVASVSRKRKRNGKGKNKDKKKRPKLAPSMITRRLLGTTATGEPGYMNLPWSCAIYSIVSWMVAYSDVEGIQTLCLKVLPFLLEDEQERLTAQNAGLTDVVLRAMVMFPQSENLHIAAFHTIVLLARPHGGREGMLFHSSMTTTGIFGAHSEHKNGGIAVMLDSMRRFQDSPVLLAMSCWALVNIALAPDQKAVLVKLGGIQATTNAMNRHPFSAELQFRALFALINLVIPSVQMETGNDNDNAINNQEDGVEGPQQVAARVAAMEEDLDEPNETSEREIIDELVGDIASLVVRAMKNFCSSEAILNRACLVLHNLSLTEDYHTTLLWTPQCYQMLEWCIANYRTDQVLQQSAAGTLHRLQLTLSQNDDLRSRFSDSLRTQQHIALEQAHSEARRLAEQHEALMTNAQAAAFSEE